MKSVDRIKEKEQWKKELDDIFCERMNIVVNETGHLLWAMTNEELVKVHIFYTDVRKDLTDLEVVENSLIAVHREVLSFDWPDDTTFNGWKDKIMSLEQLVKGDEIEGSAEVTVTLTIDDEDKENPQVGVSMQVIEDNSPLSSLRATYSEDSE